MGIIMPFWCGGVSVKETDHSDLGPLRCSERKLPVIARPRSVLGPPMENDPVSWQFTFWSLHNSNTAHLTADAKVTLSCDVPCDGHGRCRRGAHGGGNRVPQGGGSSGVRWAAGWEPAARSGHRLGLCPSQSRLPHYAALYYYYFIGLDMWI